MVSLNLTIFIELGLFLLFLWVVNRIIVRPVLQMLDERAERIAGDREATRKDREASEKLNAQYAGEIYAARRAAAQAVEEARRTATAARVEAITTRRHQSDTELAAVRQEALRQIDNQRTEMEAAARDLAASVRSRVVGLEVKP